MQHLPGCHLLLCRVTPLSCRVVLQLVFSLCYCSVFISCMSKRRDFQRFKEAWHSLYGMVSHHDVKDFLSCWVRMSIRRLDLHAILSENAAPCEPVGLRSECPSRTVCFYIFVKFLINYWKFYFTNVLVTIQSSSSKTKTMKFHWLE